ncbi:MAG: hypothetical protein WC650_00600 [Candidatus Doudnabacteria bacterium]
MKKFLFVLLMSMFLGLMMALMGCAVYPSPGCNNNEILATKAMAARTLMLEMEKREPINWHCVPGIYTQGPVVSTAATAASAASASASAAAAASATAMSAATTTVQYTNEPTGDIYVRGEGDKVIVGITESLFYRKPSAGEKVYLVGDETRWQIGYEARLTTDGYYEASLPAKSGNHQVNMVIKRSGESIQEGDPDVNWAAVEKDKSWMSNQSYKSAIRINVGSDGSVSPW